MFLAILKTRQDFEVMLNVRCSSMLQILVCLARQAAADRACSVLKSSWDPALIYVPCSRHLFVVYFFWFSWAPPQHHGVLNRGHPGVANDISFVGAEWRELCFHAETKWGLEEKILFPQVSEGQRSNPTYTMTNHGPLTDSGHSKPTYFHTFYILMIRLLPVHLKSWGAPSLFHFLLSTVPFSHISHIEKQTKQNKSADYNTSKLLKQQQHPEMDWANASRAHVHMHGIRHAGRHQKSSVDAWINVLGDNRISTVDVVIRTTLTKAANYIVKAD